MQDSLKSRGGKKSKSSIIKIENPTQTDFLVKNESPSLFSIGGCKDEDPDAVIEIDYK
jgi:hypothetical protein